ncbi:MAG: HAD-IB family phosphatase [Candidatus Lokiarchaeota archaeon]|nr:HAD-IB family phosphatase [Candidatus Lokiarchaeota archaeon]
MKIKKKGIIFSDLGGVLTETKSIWEELNLEMGMTREEDYQLYDQFINHKIDYPAWADKIFNIWRKRSPEKLNRSFLEDFFKSNLKIRRGAKEFIRKCKEDFYLIIISGTPHINLEIIQNELDFHNYYSTNYFAFNSNNQLKRIKGFKFGFEKNRIMNAILDFCGFDSRDSIAIGDSENDIKMLNEANLGILVGENIIYHKLYVELNQNVIKLKKVDFDRILKIIHHKFL